ncbi:MAG TPA: tRNA (adenosine(37)-N6)-threonylcarbamoyltransferase complex ATPase subunit type 1 TsaE [Candidatus Baltobacteraceae bacterium]|nr:tRNA (adenosine(37)-N6)-threonylcarbamoyltransferase complex ATPase subunit type 1 TsaE [Candidatus Baltobacteraceae bacterium]
MDTPETWHVESFSPEVTRTMGVALGRLLQPGDVVALLGELGSGKTVLVQGVAAGLGCPPDEVHSPSFTLVNEYACNGRGGVLAHVDLYRIRSEDELPGFGWDAYVGSAVVLVEWADRAGAYLPADHLRVQLVPAGVSHRRIAVEGTGPRARHLLRAWGPMLNGMR